MQLTPVESSHIAAVGYLEAERVLLVRYKDGALYAGAGWSAEEYALLMAAPSKGQFLRERLASPTVMIVKGGNAEDSQSTRAAPPLAAERVPAPLNVMDEDADKCCRRAFGHISNNSVPYQGDVFVCPDCGQKFVAEMVGPNRYWRCKPEVAIVRRH
jgi:hypothetical protein